MEEATATGSPPKAVAMETSYEDATVIKSEIISTLSEETTTSKISLETLDQKAETEAVTNNVEPPVEVNAASNSQTNIPVNKESVLPIANSADNGKEVAVGNIESKGDENVDRSADKTIEEVVSKAVTELKLDQTKEDVIADSVERLQPENQSSEIPNSHRTEEERNDPVIKDHVGVDEEQMDVDPCKTDIVSSVVECKKEEGEVVQRDHDQVPESEEEDEIDEAWKSDDFDLPPSDGEENYFLEPPPEVIVELYQKLDEGSILDLEWTCLGRRTPDEDGEKMEVEEIIENDQEEKVNQPVEEDPTEFDFDIDAMVLNKVTPRRIAGFELKGSGSAKKRVAKMDKVLDDIRRFSKINQEMVKTGDTALPPLQTDPEMTPQRPLGKFHIRRDLHQ